MARFVRIECQVQTRILRRTDGLIFGARVEVRHGTRLLADDWYWLDRETDELEQLRPYRVGMFDRGVADDRGQGERPPEHAGD